MALVRSTAEDGSHEEVRFVLTLLSDEAEAEIIGERQVFLNAETITSGPISWTQEEDQFIRISYNSRVYILPVGTKKKGEYLQGRRIKTA